MPASYPSSIVPVVTVSDNVDYVLADHVNELYLEVNAIEAILGVNPQGASATVAALLTALNSGKAPTAHTHVHGDLSALTADDHGQYMLAAGGRHDLSTRHAFGGALGTPGTPASLTFGATSAVGTGTAPARDNHAHGMPNPGNATTVSAMTAFAIAPSVGTSPNAAHEDHNHGTPSASLTGPAGIVAMWPSATPPTGWLMCDGGAVSRTTYSVLFGIIGTKYGPGNGSTTFNLPAFNANLIPIGQDMNAGLITGGIGAHAHGASSAGTTHNHGAGTSAGSTHSHSLSQPGATNVGSSHGHGTSVGTETGEHQHGITATAGGSHFYTEFSDPSQPHSHSVGVIPESGHTHTIADSSVGAEAAHTHDVTVVQETTHTHGVTVNAASVLNALGIAFIIKT